MAQKTNKAGNATLENHIDGALITGITLPLNALKSLDSTPTRLRTADSVNVGTRKGDRGGRHYKKLARKCCSLRRTWTEERPTAVSSIAVRTTDGRMDGRTRTDPDSDAAAAAAAAVLTHDRAENDTPVVVVVHPQVAVVRHRSRHRLEVRLSYHAGRSCYEKQTSNIFNKREQTLKITSLYGLQLSLNVEI